MKSGAPGGATVAVATRIWTSATSSLSRTAPSSVSAADPFRFSRPVRISRMGFVLCAAHVSAIALPQSTAGPAAISRPLGLGWAWLELRRWGR